MSKSQRSFFFFNKMKTKASIALDSKNPNIKIGRRVYVFCRQSENVTNYGIYMFTDALILNAWRFHCFLRTFPNVRIFNARQSYELCVTIFFSALEEEYKVVLSVFSIIHSDCNIITIFYFCHAPKKSSAYYGMISHIFMFILQINGLLLSIYTSFFILLFSKYLMHFNWFTLTKTQISTFS